MLVGIFNRISNAKMKSSKNGILHCQCIHEKRLTNIIVGLQTFHKYSRQADCA